MARTSRGPNPIDAYLAALPAAQRDALSRLRAIIRSAVPDAEEAIRTNVPAMRYMGRTVVGFGAGKAHLALYVMFGDALQRLRPELASFDTSSKVVRFTPDRPLPPALVRKVVALRIAEIEAQSTPRTESGPGRSTRR